MRALAAAALGAILALALAACGETGTVTMSVEAQTAAEQRLAAEVRDQLRGYETGFDLESMPDEQAAQLEPIVDNLPQAAGGVSLLRVEGRAVTAETDYAAGEQGEQTGRLICGAIVRAGGEAAASQVLGENDDVLADCEATDADFP